MNKRPMPEGGFNNSCSPKVKKRKLFNMKSKNIFLTYPQIGDITREEIKDFLCSKLKLKKYVIALEKHEDGGNHIHAHISLAYNKNIKNERFFDYKGHHPNIQSMRNVNACRNYVMKDGNYIYHGYKDEPITPDVWKEAMDLAKDDAHAAIDLLDQKKPQDMLKFGHNIEANIKRRENTQIYKNNEFKFKDLPKVFKWKTLMLETRALWLMGASNVGKTEYAKSLFRNPILVRHKDGLKRFNPRLHDCIIFDDMNFKHWPRESVIHLLDLQNDSEIDVKHGTAMIPRGVARIFLSNVPIWPDDHTGAIQRRLYTVVIREDLRIMDNNNEDQFSDGDWEEARQGIITLNVSDRSNEKFVS